MKQYIIYADIESILEPIVSNDADINSNTNNYQRHIPSSIGFYFKNREFPERSYFDFNRGPDCIEWFCKKLISISDRVFTLPKKFPKPHLSNEEEYNFLRSTICHICSMQFTSSDLRVRDHCHHTGKYRGAAHTSCNLNYRDNRIIPVVFHNLSHYDSHFIILKINSIIGGPTSLLPNNDENYISFTKTILKAGFGENIQFRFIDSFRFLASSLSKLASYLPYESLLHTRFEMAINSCSEQQIKLACRKGVFPYDYVDCWSRYNDLQLPPKNKFYSKLVDSNISDNDYEHAQAVWKDYKIQNLGEYSDLYLKIDVLLLVDVFENFRNTCHQIYKLDPAHYFTAPALSWDAMLKYTEVKLELLTDVDKLLFVEKGLRGGISQCSHRYAKANNKYMDCFDKTKPTEQLIYLDANNLYGWAMMQCLPLSDFEWFPNTDLDVSKIPDDNSEGYFLEVDLEYPESIHDNHSDYPMCAEHKNPPGSTQPKLLLTLDKKIKYVLHYLVLKQAIKYGLILKKVYRILKFKQSTWMKPYIELNTKYRTMANNAFEKNFYKLLNNSVFGKTMENVRKHREIKLCSKWLGCGGARKLVADPYFKTCKIFSEDCVAIELNKKSILMNKPVSIGMAILEISKVLMYDYHYGHIKPIFKENIKLLYTDTDSFIYQISNVNFYDEMKLNNHMYDTSGYSANNQFKIIPQNSKLPGLMKDEINGGIITEFAGLRSKMYSIRIDKRDTIKKAKGVKNYVVAKHLKFQDYLECINNNCTLVRTQNTIQSKSHILHTQTQTKIALSSNDDKRYLISNSTRTLPWGHFSIRN